MSFSRHWQRSTRMLRPCSHNIMPATAPSPVTVTRDIGPRPTQHRLSMIHPCPCVALVSLILSLLFSSVAFSSNIALDGRPCRFVSKLRRLLSRDDLKHRRGSRATARTAWTASVSFKLFFFFFFCPWRSTRTTCKRPAIHFSTSYCPLIWGYYFLFRYSASRPWQPRLRIHIFFFCLILVFILPSVSCFFLWVFGQATFQRGVLWHILATYVHWGLRLFYSCDFIWLHIYFLSMYIKADLPTDIKQRTNSVHLFYQEYLLCYSTKKIPKS